LFFCGDCILSSAGEDFMPIYANLIFNQTVSRQCFNITLINDDHYELREDFFVNLTTNSLRIDIRPLFTIVMIVDEDSKFCLPAISGIILEWALSAWQQNLIGLAWWVVNLHYNSGKMKWLK
jgi:hypothetical protein